MSAAGEEYRWHCTASDAPAIQGTPCGAQAKWDATGHLTFESFSCRGLEGLLSELDFAAQPSKDLHVHSWSCRLEMWRM